MFVFTKVVFDDPARIQIFAKFLSGVKTHLTVIDAASGECIRDYNASSVVRLGGDGHILKLIKPRRILEYFKLLYLHNRAHKEVQGNCLLKSIGVAVPEVLDYGYGFIPARPYIFTGYLMMENLVLKGFSDARELLDRPDFDKAARERFFGNLCADISKMRDNRIVFNDLKLGNLFVNPAGDAVWIDTGVTKYSACQSKKFIEKHNFSLSRFLKRAGQFLHDNEKARLEALLF